MNKGKIIIDCLPRSGSNHLAANLHFQKYFFSYSERVRYDSLTAHDVFGNREPAREFNNVKWRNKKYQVWKRFWTRTGTRHYDIPFSSENPVVIIFHIRHPFMVYSSMMKYITQTTQKPQNPWVGWFKEETIHEVALAYDNMFRKLCYAKSRGTKYVMFYHERYLKEGPEYLSLLLKKMNTSPYKKIQTYEGYLKQLNETSGRNRSNSRLKIVENIKPGYGVYMPWREVDFAKEIERIKECPLPLPAKICAKIYNDRELWEEHFANTGHLTIQEELEEFQDFYTKTIFEL